jgi:putative oxidoreductase
MNLREFYLELSVLFGYLQSFTLLFIRLAVAYGFYEPSMIKWANLEVTATWFRELGIPLSTFFAFVTASFELIGVVLLVAGLFTRLISVPLIIIMIIAILTVHLANGFSAGANGIEIPLYYLLFLSILATHGAGKFSLDEIFNHE